MPLKKKGFLLRGFLRNVQKSVNALKGITMCLLATHKSYEGSAFLLGYNIWKICKYFKNYS